MRRDPSRRGPGPHWLPAVVPLAVLAIGTAGVAAEPADRTATPAVRLLSGEESEARQVRELLASVPELSRFAVDFVPFDRRSIDAALRRGDRSRASITAWRFATPVFLWQPAADRRYRVVTGVGGGQAVLAVLRVGGDGSHTHAGSIVVAEADTSIAVGYAADKPAQLLWTTCFGCEGESGDIIHTDAGRLDFTYR